MLEQLSLTGHTDHTTTEISFSTEADYDAPGNVKYEYAIVSAYDGQLHVKVGNTSAALTAHIGSCPVFQGTSRHFKFNRGPIPRLSIIAYTGTVKGTITWCNPTGT